MKRIYLILVFSSFIIGKIYAQCDTMKDATINVSGIPVISDYKGSILIEGFQSTLLEVIQNKRFMWNTKPSYKSMPCYNEEDLRAFERYTPDEITFNGKMLNFINYVNLPEQHEMPNMDLKESVWFMETFFNIGVCEQQKYFVARTHSKKTYEITIPIAERNGRDIILKGKVLQHFYRNLLSEIIKEICPEYSLNFGDVYVKFINYGTNTVGLGIDVLYGTKGEHKFNVAGRRKILPNNKSVPVYPDGGTHIVPPLSTYDVFGDFHRYNPSDEDNWILDTVTATQYYCRDEFMEILLNSELARNVTSILNYRRMAMTLNPFFGGRLDVDIIQQYYLYWYDNLNAPLQYQVKYTTPSLTGHDYQHYGNIYKDYIYAHLCNDITTIEGATPEHAPFLACCFYMDYTPVADYGVGVWQDFGLEYICIFDNRVIIDFLDSAPCVIRFEHPEFQPFIAPL